MAVTGVISDEAEATYLDTLLRDFRNDPPVHGDPRMNDAMARCSRLLYSLKYPDSSSQHWFCSKTPPVAQEVATFLIRLHAYQKGDEYKQGLLKVLAGCSDCVKGYLKARTRSDET